MERATEAEIERAKGLGTAAFAADNPGLPVMDSAIMGMIACSTAERNADLLRAWCEGWEDAMRMDMRRTKLANMAFWGGNDAVYRDACAHFGYAHDGGQYPANGLTKAQVAQYVATMTDDQVNQALDVAAALQ